jgi:hypothetical protein
MLEPVTVTNTATVVTLKVVFQPAKHSKEADWEEMSRPPNYSAAHMVTLLLVVLSLLLLPLLLLSLLLHLFA